jgi:hypothetical protein
MKNSVIRNIRLPADLLPRIAGAARAESARSGYRVSINGYVVRACQRACEGTEREVAIATESRKGEADA